MSSRGTIVNGRTTGSAAGVNLPLKVTAYGDGTGVLLTAPSSGMGTVSSAAGSVAAAAAATDVAVIGTNSEYAYVRRVIVSGVATAAGSTTLLLIARSTPESGGTSTDVDGVNLFTFAAGQNYLRLFTANPTVGTSAGVLAQQHLQYSSAALGVAPVPMVFDFTAAPVRVGFTGETSLAINLNGATVAGLTLNITVEFDEV